MALDEPADGDRMLRHDGLTFVIEALLFESAQPIKIDLTRTDTEAEFTVSSTILENNCSLAESPSLCYASCTI
jgi:Fe-S cluster assembly iron-binding protein IscA